MPPKNNRPRCSHKSVEPRVIRDEFDYGPADDRITIVAEAVPVLVCAECGEIFYGPEAGHAHHRAICKALHLLTPEEIKGVRDQLGKNQAEFAQLTGVGVATLSRWEQGRLMQTRAHDNYLRLLHAVPAAIRVLERPKGPPPTPWRSLEITDSVRKRRARFRLHTNPTQPKSAAERLEESIPSLLLEESSVR